ncbi:heme peroxidase family protein [Streptomyces xinghaiensis]|uniref:peroxidase family protein n=1 Tax=Streptomyces xinghaiensis TaxID=1038928 RepID=UPI002E1281F3|nr:heme peroxidase family protein [Streptomyces xinghaiensis]
MRHQDHQQDRHQEQHQDQDPHRTGGGQQPDRRRGPRRRHHRESYFLVNEGDGGRVLETSRGRRTARPATAEERKTSFRFSRLSREKGQQISEELRTKLALAMTAATTDDQDSRPGIPAGYTYLGQFVDHDLTMDATRIALGENLPVEELEQGRSPSLDLDSVYGLGPRHPGTRAFYERDGRLRTGTALGVPFPADFEPANTDQPGFDLPRAGESAGGTAADRRAPLVPDPRNDENLIVAQTHLAFIRLHNRVHADLERRGLPPGRLFQEARELVVKHYQWMLRTDFLPRIVDEEIVESVFTEGRRFFEVPAGRPGPFPGIRQGDRPTMPIEFSVAAYRLGHSMIRGAYQWNRVFNSNGGPGGIGTLGLMFRFSGTSGNLSPGPDDLSDLNDPEAGDNLRLPSNWIADFRRLYDFGEAGRADLTVPAAEFNLTRRIDTVLVDPLATLPTGTFGGRDGGPAPDPLHLNLAFRNLTRAAMVELATGPQLAKEMGIDPLTDEQILTGSGGAPLDTLTAAEREELVAHTPLWFYVLREAEVNPKQPGRLTGVGGNLVAEVFHRAMEGSRHSIVRDRRWRPTLPARQEGRFTMTDLLLHAFEGRADLLNPMGDGPVPASPAGEPPAGR